MIHTISIYTFKLEQNIFGLKQEDLLYSTRNYIQCLVRTYNGKESEKDMYTCFSEYIFSFKIYLYITILSQNIYFFIYMNHLLYT